MSPKQKVDTDNSGFDEWNIFDSYLFFGLFSWRLTKCTKIQ